MWTLLRVFLLYTIISCISTMTATHFRYLCPGPTGIIIYEYLVCNQVQISTCKQCMICTYSLPNNRFKAVLKPASVQVHYHAMDRTLHWGKPRQVTPAAPLHPAFISSGGNWEGNDYFCCLLPRWPHHSCGKEGMRLDQGFSCWQSQFDINFYVLYINQFEWLS